MPHTHKTGSLVPRSFIDELLNRSDIVELIDHYVPLKKRGSSYLACCPFHNEKTPSFNVVPKKQYYHCFGCGVNGNAISFIMAYLNQGFVDALKTLAAKLGMVLPQGQDHDPQKLQHSLSLYQLLQKVSQYYQNSLKNSSQEAIPYLRERGLTGEIAKRFQIGYALDGWHTLEKHFKSHKKELVESGMLIQKEDGNSYDRYRNRIMFPIHDKQGRIIGFGGRAIKPQDNPKYLNSPESSIFQKNRELYGLYQVLQEKDGHNTILVVEGYLDVIALAQYGICNAVATLGTATSSWHIQILAKHCKQIIFCFDGDLAGKNAANRALEQCLPHLDKSLDIRFIFLPENEDPDSLVRSQGKEALEAYIKEAIPLHQQLMSNLQVDIEMGSIMGKSQLLDKARPYLQTIPESSYRQLLIDELSRLTHIENHRIMQMLSPTFPSGKPSGNAPIQRSPIRLAIAIIIQNPEIYDLCKNDIPENALNGKRHEILQKLLQIINENPSINTAGLLEFWRSSSVFNALGKLASWELPIPEDGLAKEFIDTLGLLRKQNLEHQIDYYRNKLNKHGLSAPEKLLLQDLLQKKHKIA